MEHYSDYAKYVGVFSTGIHTKISDKYRVTSAYRKFSNSYFESWGWETFLWVGDDIEHQYEVKNSAEDVVNLHTKIAKTFWQEGEFYKED